MSCVQRSPPNDTAVLEAVVDSDLVQDATPLRDLYTESGQTLEGSFSAVSTATIARVVAFFRIFRDLQDVHSFAPLQNQNFSKFRIFSEILRDFSQFLRIFQNVIVFLLKFDQNFSDFNESWRILANSESSSKVRQKFVKSSSKVRRILTIRNKFVSLSFWVTNSEFAAT